MNEFEEWWCDFSNQIVLGMGLFLPDEEKEEFREYFEKGVPPIEAAKQHYKEN